MKNITHLNCRLDHFASLVGAIEPTSNGWAGCLCKLKISMPSKKVSSAIWIMSGLRETSRWSILWMRALASVRNVDSPQSPKKLCLSEFKSNVTIFWAVRSSVSSKMGGLPDMHWNRTHPRAQTSAAAVGNPPITTSGGRYALEYRTSNYEDLHLTCTS